MDMSRLRQRRRIEAALLRWHRGTAVEASGLKLLDDILSDLRNQFGWDVVGRRSLTEGIVDSLVDRPLLMTWAIAVWNHRGRA